VAEQNVVMTSLVAKAIAEEHHLEEIAKDGYAPATLPIVLAAIVVALTVIVGLALGVTLAVYYLT
jgi:diacylglycerol kinase